MVMALVDYSDSEDEPSASLAKKRRKLSSPAADDDAEGVGVSAALPPLPSAFLDQYSSTVRTSTQDDPSLHGGRKRVTPHVEGNWPAHVYLEWHPSQEASGLLSELITAATTTPQKEHTKTNEGTNQQRSSNTSATHNNEKEIHSLLHTPLDVPLPLHISLSRPLTLKSPQKAPFLAHLASGIQESGIRAFDVQAKDLAWHTNEGGTRWFLVLRLWDAGELGRLLEVCNGVAREFGMPLLYDGDSGGGGGEGRFHVSVAWALSKPERAAAEGRNGVGILLERLTELELEFREVKVRIGQEVHAVSLRRRRGSVHTSPSPASS